MISGSNLVGHSHPCEYVTFGLLCFLLRVHLPCSPDFRKQHYKQDFWRIPADRQLRASSISRIYSGSLPNFMGFILFGKTIFVVDQKFGHVLLDHPLGKWPSCSAASTFLLVPD